MESNCLILMRFAKKQGPNRFGRLIRILQQLRIVPDSTPLITSLGHVCRWMWEDSYRCLFGTGYFWNILSMAVLICFTTFFLLSLRFSFAIPRHATFLSLASIRSTTSCPLCTTVVVVAPGTAPHTKKLWLKGGIPPAYPL